MRVQSWFVTLNGYYNNRLVSLPTAVLVLRYNRKNGVFLAPSHDRCPYATYVKHTPYSLMRHITRCPYDYDISQRARYRTTSTRYHKKTKTSHDADAKYRATSKSQHMILCHIRRGGELRTWRGLPDKKDGTDFFVHQSPPREEFLPPPRP